MDIKNTLSKRNYFHVVNGVTLIDTTNDEDYYSYHDGFEEAIETVYGTVKNIGKLLYEEYGKKDFWFRLISSESDDFFEKYSIYFITLTNKEALENCFCLMKYVSTEAKEYHNMMSGVEDTTNSLFAEPLMSNIELEKKLIESGKNPSEQTIIGLPLSDTMKRMCQFFSNTIVFQIKSPFRDAILRADISLDNKNNLDTIDFSVYKGRNPTCETEAEFNALFVKMADAMFAEE